MVIAVTLAGASFLFVPDDLYNAAQSAAAATLFAANILFFLEAGYFDAASYEKPLLHTWSLGIEEQFYIFLPLLLLALARWGGRMGLWIGLLTLASLALSVLTTSAVPTAAYYLLPWRAWELGIGALLALGVAPSLARPVLREAAAGLGLLLILGAALLITKETPFPGAAALAPTLGAALVIQAGRGGASAAGRLLSTAIPVWIGRLSYSLYLWHWPIIAGLCLLPDGSAHGNGGGGALRARPRGFLAQLALRRAAVPPAGVAGGASAGVRRRGDRDGGRAARQWRDRRDQGPARPSA